MGFSKEWEEIYREGAHNSVWPWPEVISYTKHYFHDREGIRVLELGCGAGANIPFFVSEKMNYFGLEGSETQVEKLNRRFAGKNVTIAKGDFTKEIPFEGEYDLILDRSALTHNPTQGIKNAITLIKKKLKKGGFFFGVDWFSVHHTAFTDEKECFDVIDENTRYFHTGYFAGLGNVHFSDADHIRRLFCEFEIAELYEKVNMWQIPKKDTAAFYNFVAENR